MHPQMYILEGKEPVVIKCAQAWARWMFGEPAFEDESEELINRRLVGKDQINKDIMVSTVFLGISSPLVADNGATFETCVFHNDNESKDVPIQRYLSWNDALKGHKAAVARTETNSKRRKQKATKS